MRLPVVVIPPSSRRLRQWSGHWDTAHRVQQQQQPDACSLLTEMRCMALTVTTGVGLLELSSDSASPAQYTYHAWVH